MNLADHHSTESRTSFWGWQIVFGAWLVLLAALAGVVIPFYLSFALRGYYLHYFVSAWFAVTIGILLSVLVAAYFRDRVGWILSPAASNFYLYATAGLISLVILFYSIERWRGYRTWAIVQEELRKSGENLDPIGPPPEGLNIQNNFYLAPAITNLLSVTYPSKNPVRYSIPAGNSAKQISPPSQTKWWLNSVNAAWQGVGISWFLQEGVDFEAILRVWQGQGLVSQEALATPAVSVMQALNEHRDLLDELREASQRTHAWPYHSHLNIYQGEPTHYAFQHVLLLRASAALAHGQSSDALQDILAAFRIAQHAWQLPFPNVWEHQFLLQPIWDGLAQHRWNSQDLIILGQALRQADVLSHHRSILRKQLFFNMALFNYIIPIMEPYPSSQEAIQNYGEDGGMAIQILRWIYPQGWAYQNQAGIYYQYQKHRDDLDNAYESKAWAGFRIAPEFPSVDPFYATFIAPRVFASCDSVIQSLFSQLAIDLARIGCALERYYLDQGQYPDRLEVLYPDYLPVIPKDLMSGDVFRYRIEPSGLFVLYSVGWNGQDDGGRTSIQSGFVHPLSMTDLRDVIWAYQR